MPNNFSPERSGLEGKHAPSGPLTLPPPTPMQGGERAYLVIAIVMAVVLWLFVRTGGHAPTTRELIVPVAITQAPQGLGIHPNEVIVKLTGPPNEDLSANEIAAIASLAGRVAGERVPLRMVPPRGFRVIGVEPPEVEATATVPLAPERIER